jgi:ornithine carbamoyltransferase
MVKKKMNRVFFCAAAFFGMVVLAGCPEKKSGTQEIIDAAKNLGKTVEKNAPAALEDLGKAAGKAADMVKKAAESDAAKDAAKKLGEAAKDAVDSAEKIIKQATED